MSGSATPNGLKPRSPEPRWPAVGALLAVGAVNLALTSSLSIGPDWLVFAAVAALSTPALVLHDFKRCRAALILGFSALSIATIAMIVSLVLLINGLVMHTESPVQLLRSAGLLWLSNIVIFASWYWRLDAGGPHQRDSQGAHTDGAFLFPQMTLDPELRKAMGEEDWKPGFVDYLFLAFNTSTAFSPTDVPVLSRWAKILMMIQSVISLGTIALVAARAVNIL